LRQAFPEVHLEILGYKHIIALAEGRFYAHATRSIEYAGLATFFIPGTKLPPDLVDYFAGYQQVVSYLFDPDGFFEANLRRAGVKNLISAYSQIDEDAQQPVHAARQLARPLEKMALFLEQDREAAQPTLYPSEEDRAFAADFLQGSDSRKVIAAHPGSGGAHKLWPLAHWQTLLDALRAAPDAPRILLVGGEADTERLTALQKPGDLLALDLPLPKLGAVLERCTAFVGHDSGISHLAAAAGVPSLLLFGPTLPAVWAPAGAHVRVLEAPPCQETGGHGDLTQVAPQTVLESLLSLLGS
jgi:heptosyltransferase-2